jgi:hypothetical protein
MADSEEVNPGARPRGRRRSAGAAAAAEPAPRIEQGPAAEPPAEVEEAPPRRASRGRRVVAEPPAEEEQEQEEEAEPPPRGLRRLRHENANRQRNENNNGNDAPIGPDEEREGGDAEDEGEGGEGEGAGGAMGMIAQMLQGTVNFLKTDPIKETYNGAREEPPYPALQDLYDRVKENPDDQDVIEEASTSFTELKNGFQPEGCDTDINIAMKQRCAGVKAGLYLGLYDIRKSIDESLRRMRPIQQPAVLRRINRAARPEYEVANNNNQANVFVPADL